MIIFTHLAPEYFINMMGQYKLENVRTIDVFNLTSLDIRFPNISNILPTIENISQEALAEGNDKLFEKEYFNFLLLKCPTMIGIIQKEFKIGASHLTIIEIQRSSYRDEIVFSIQKFLYTNFGIKAIIFSDLEDWEDISPMNSMFNINGLAIMDIYNEMQDQEMGCVDDGLF